MEETVQISFSFITHEPVKKHVLTGTLEPLKSFTPLLAFISFDRRE